MRALSWRVAWRSALLFCVLLLAVLVMLADPSWLRAQRHLMFDQYQRWQPRVWQDTAVRIIDVDEESLRRIGQWPWPRTRMAELVTLAQEGGAAAIGFDMAFSEPDRTSPAAMARTWRLPASAQRALTQTLPDHDAVFAQALRQGHTVLGFGQRAAAPGRDETGPPLTPGPARYVQRGPVANAFVPQLSAVVPPLPVLAQAAAGQGALAFVPDGDGVIRRMPLVLRVGDQLLPSLTAEMLRVGQEQANYVLHSSPQAGGGLVEVRVGAIALPVTPSGELWNYYAPPTAARSIPAWQLLQGEVPPDALRGRLLLVGSSAQGLMDLRFSPLSGVTPGVEVHAQALEQALTGEFLSRPAWTAAAEALALLAGGLLVAVLAMNAGPVLSAGAALLVVATFGAAGWWAFRSAHLLLDPLAPALGVLAVYLLASGLRHQASEQRRRWLARAFSRYVSPNLVSHIVRHPELLALSGERRECSFVFTDVVGFTSLMERVDPQAAVSLLNAYLDGMIEIVFRHQGTLDRIVGDGLAIMFSAPVPQADHRQRALDCALDLQRFAHAFATRPQAMGAPLGHTRIGVHSGEVILGNFGGRAMFDYRALGDVVNTASRLEGANKYLGTKVCVSEATLAGCAGVRVRCVARLQLKGKCIALRVYQPLHDGLDGPVNEAALQAYEEAYAAMAAGRSEALAAFEALGQADPDDPLVQLHLQRLRRGETGDLMVLDGK
jgi:adenylate cyclase